MLHDGRGSQCGGAIILYSTSTVQMSPRPYPTAMTATSTVQRSTVITGITVPVVLRLEGRVNGLIAHRGPLHTSRRVGGFLVERTRCCASPRHPWKPCPGSPIRQGPVNTVLYLRTAQQSVLEIASHIAPKHCRAPISNVRFQTSQSESWSFVCTRPVGLDRSPHPCFVEVPKLNAGSSAAEKGQAFACVRAVPLRHAIERPEVSKTWAEFVVQYTVT